MPIRKKGNIDIRTSAKGAQATQTGYTFYSYDKNSAALYFEFNDQNGQPTDLKKATVRLVMILNDDDKKNASVMTKAEIISELRGTAKYDIPESLLGYEGKVTGYVYLEFEDGSHTDEGRFIFNIKRSMISDVLPEAGDKYVQDFEDVKERVEQAGDSATKDIEKAKDDAESQIGDYVGEVESAKQDISSSASDVQSKADQAKKDMQDNADQVESDYQAWKEQQEKKQEDFEATTDEKVSNITERVGEAENKASDLERHLDVGQKNYFSVTSWEDNASNDVVENNLPAVKLKLEVNTQYTLSTNIPTRGEPSSQTSLFFATSDVNRVNSYIHGVSVNNPRTITTNDDGVVIVAIWGKDITSGDWRIMLNKGSTAYDWVPNTDDLATKQELEKIKQAIINLGGSI